MPLKQKSKSDKLSKAQQLLSFMNEGLSREDFTSSFKNVVDYVKRVDFNLTSNFRQLAKTLTDKINQVQVDHEATRALKDKIEGHIATLREGVKPIKGIDYFDGKDGETPKKGIHYFDGKPGKNGLDGSPDTPKQIRDKIASLKGPQRITTDHIHGLNEVLEDVQEKARTAYSAAIGVNRPQITFIDLSSSLDGSTVDFNTQAFQRVIQITISSWPTILRPNVDFTESHSPTKITFIGQIAANKATILAAGQTCIALVLA